ncbi:glycerate kinase [Lacticaseibacillus sp. GG6-2]
MSSTSEAMRIVVAIDSFKGSLTSLAAEKAVASGILRVQPEAVVQTVPIADGGEGTVAALLAAVPGATAHPKVVQDALGNKTTATFAMLDAHTAVIEMAQAAGLAMTDQSLGQAMQASTYGVGELLLAAVARGAKRIYVGLGGSATTDGGAGMAQALGVQLRTATGAAICPGAAGLAELDQIDVSELAPELEGIDVRLLADVTNPLLGATGAAAVYGPQKGLTPDAVVQVDVALDHYARLVAQATGVSVAATAGAGAAGGLGAGLMAFTHAKVEPGIQTILRLAGMPALMAKADAVITGEGRIDAQTANGKAPAGVAALAKQYQLPVIAVCGARAEAIDPVFAAGIDVVLPIGLKPQPLASALAATATNLTVAGETAMRILTLH